MSCEKTSSVSIMVTDSIKPRNNRQRVWFLLFSLAVSVTIFSYLFSTVSIQEVAALLAGISMPWIFFFLLLSFSMSLFRTWRYLVVLGASGYRPNSIAMYLVTLVRNFFSDLLPARLGTLIYIYLVQSRLGVPFGAAASSFALSFIFDILSFACLIIVAVMVVSSGSISPVMVGVGGGILALGSVGVLLLLPWMLDFMAGICSGLPLVPERYRLRLQQALTDVCRDIEQARRQRIYWRIFFLSLGVRCCKYLSLYVLLLALVLPLGFTVSAFPLGKVFLGLCSAELAASLPISGIAGFGAYEGAWALIFQLLGYSERIAALTSISHHLLTQVYGYTLGACALLVLLLPVFQRRHIREARMQSDPAPFFWGRFIGTCIMLLGLCFFLWPTQGHVARVNTADQSANNQALAAEAAFIDKLVGKVVYQRSDGIYQIREGDKFPQRLLGYGTSPRWSSDGKRIAFVHGNAIMLLTEKSGKVRQLATAGKAKALCFYPDGQSVIFTDGNFLRRVEISNGKVTTLLAGDEFREVDIAEDGIRLAATVRTPYGIKVRVFDLQTGSNRTVSRGCSASISPDGNRITVNGKKHRVLKLYNWNSLQPAGRIHAPAGRQFDNQFWSNSPEWIVSTAEGKRHDIFIHHVRSDAAYQLTTSGDCDRADLYVMSTMLP